MADDPKSRGPQDRSRINTEQDYEVQYWTKELGISAEVLTRFVGQHGNSADEVRAALGK